MIFGRESFMGWNLDEPQNLALLTTDFLRTILAECFHKIALCKRVPKTPTYSESRPDFHTRIRNTINENPLIHNRLVLRDALHISYWTRSVGGRSLSV